MFVHFSLSMHVLTLVLFVAVNSFVDTRSQGLDRVIPRSVLERAKGFAIFSVFKAGFVFSARGRSGVFLALIVQILTEDGKLEVES